MKKNNRAKSGALSRNKILQAALQLADNDGIESLSMRKLAEKLGVKAMSLYNHVKNKDDIIDGIVDIVFAEITLPANDLAWKIAMEQRAISAHKVLLKHSWATMAIASRANVGPAALRYVDTTLGYLLGAGFSFEIADHVWNAVDSYIYGFTLQKLNFPFEEAEYATVAKEYLPLIPATQYPHLHGLTNHVISGNYDGIHDFKFGLEILLNGFEMLRKPNI